MLPNWMNRRNWVLLEPNKLLEKVPEQLNKMPETDKLLEKLLEKVPEQPNKVRELDKLLESNKVLETE